MFITKQIVVFNDFTKINFFRFWFLMKPFTISFNKDIHIVLKHHLIFIFLLHLKRFRKKYKTFFLKKKTSKLKKILIKKNLFFKKYYDTKILVSRRLINVLKKNKKLKFFKKNKNKNKNHFFLKKFFLKTLLNSRVLLKKIFSLNKKVRQKRLTKILYKKSKNIVRNNTMEYSIYNIILRGHFFFFLNDAVVYIKSGFVYLNGRIYSNHTYSLNKGDVLQIRINSIYFRYFKFCKKFFKKKVKLIRYEAYKFFRKKTFQKEDKVKVKLKKRKYPDYYLFFFLYKLNVPRYLEVDYTILSIIILKKLDISLHTTYYVNKLFSYKLFNLYNYKKIN